MKEVDELVEWVAIRLTFDCQNCTHKPLTVDCANPCEQRVYLAKQILSHPDLALIVKKEEGKTPLEIYHRLELFWYEPEVTEILDDLFCGESDEVHLLTDKLFELEPAGEDWRIRPVIPLAKEVDKCPQP